MKPNHGQFSQHLTVVAINVSEQRLSEAAFSLGLHKLRIASSNHSPGKYSTRPNTPGLTKTEMASGLFDRSERIKGHKREGILIRKFFSLGQSGQVAPALRRSLAVDSWLP
jgi:hypothetical protein